MRRINKKRWIVVGDMDGKKVFAQSDRKNNIVRLRRSGGGEWTVPRDEFRQLIKSTSAWCRPCGGGERGGKLQYIDLIHRMGKLEMFLVCNRCGCYHKMIGEKPYLYRDPGIGVSLLFGGELGHPV